MNYFEIKQSHCNEELSVSEFDQDNEIEIQITDSKLHENNGLQIYLSPNETNELVNHLICQLKSVNEYFGMSWIDVKIKLPKIGDRVMFFVDHGDSTDCYSERVASSTLRFMSGNNITHWMPFPKNTSA